MPEPTNEIAPLVNQLRQLARELEQEAAIIEEDYIDDSNAKRFRRHASTAAAIAKALDLPEPHDQRQRIPVIVDRAMARFISDVAVIAASPTGIQRVPPLEAISLAWIEVHKENPCCSCCDGRSSYDAFVKRIDAIFASTGLLNPG